MLTSAIYETPPGETEFLVIGAGVAGLRAAIALAEARRGAYYRTDSPAHDDKRFLKHSVVRGDSIRFQ